MRITATFALLLLLAPSLQADETTDLASVYDLLRSANREAAAQKLAEVIPLYPSSVEMKALAISLLVTRDPERAWKLAEQLRHAHPESPWAWYAVAAAGTQTPVAGRIRAGLEAAAKIEALAPKPLPEMLERMKVGSMLRVDKTKEVLAYLGDRTDAVGLHLRAQAVERSRTNEKANEEAAALYVRGLEAAPDDMRIAVSYLHALASVKSPLALETGKRFVEKAPLSPSLREMYWYAIQSSRDQTAEERAAAITADMDEFLKGNDSLSALQATSDWIRRLERKERSQELDREIVRRFPESPEAQFAVYRMMYQDGWTASTDPAVLAGRRQRIQTFLDYPYHASEQVLGAVYQQLMSLNRTDPTIDDAEYLRPIDAVAAYVRESYVAKTEVAAALAERGLRLATAEKLAREGLTENPKMYEPEKDTLDGYDKYVTEMRGWSRGVLGFVLTKRKKFQEAGRQLTLAAKESPTHPQVLYYLGNWQERSGDAAAAEMSYASGMAHEEKTGSKNLAALEALYTKRRGSASGFDEYAANLRLAGSSDEKRQILATRLIPAKRVKASFELTSLDGKRVALADTNGRVTVLNFWGIWCGPCVSEMPYVQKLHEKYAADPRVRILTINNDSDPKKVPTWMKTKGFTFPVLLDDGFIDRAKGDIGAFPTTWFLDANGRIAFVKSGAIHNLVEEFSWRIDALKATAVER